MKILHSADDVNNRINQIAQDIIDEYAEDMPLFICLLKGAVPFTSKLMSAIARTNSSLHPEVEYMHVSAYGEDRKANKARMYTGIDAAKITSRDVIIIDDCLDQGITYTETKQYLLQQGASSVSLVVLANKDVQRQNVDQPIITGFDVPNVWLVGMGMDDSASAPEAERWAEYIGDAS